MPPKSRSSRPARSLILLASSIVLLALLVGCDSVALRDDAVVRAVRENACINQCQETKDTCDADARFDYRQCEAGYTGAQRQYRRCQASSAERCGYPWWDCAENRYGYCTNRFWECRQRCVADNR